jgi:trans-aconitate methyltransferase
MNSANFSEIAARYERDSLIQKSASEKLLGLIEIGRNEDVLDLGCGTGNLTRKMKGITLGSVVGADSSKGMIREAGKAGKDPGITFVVKAAEEIDYRERFDVIFCNSAFQWFRDTAIALRNCCAALRKGGRMGIQAPAKKIYCPNFVKAIAAVERDPRTGKTFSGFKPPWLFFDTAEEYSRLFEQAGFAVPFAVIDEIKTVHSADEVMTIFESGAAAGYLNQEFYEARVDRAYGQAFREIVKDSFHRQANKQGQVELVFNRIYLLAERKGGAQ